MKIEYYPTTKAYPMYLEKLKGLARKPDVIKVCDIGGGANPLFSKEQVEEYGLDYTVLDISAEELAKAPEKYNKIQADITDSNFSLDGEYDLVISKFLAEHISDAASFHQNIFSLLKDGGYSFHYFPTLYNLPFIANRLLPENLSYPILLFFQPHRVKEGKRGKFPASYNWCFGPTKKNIERFTSLGYSIEEYIGFFGHRFYQKSKILKPLDLLEQLKMQLLLRYPVPLMTQFAQVMLRKEALLD